MIQFKDETVINTSPDKVFYFLTNIDKLYKEWHPKDHVFCKVLYSSLNKKNSIVHFFEWIGNFPLYLIARTKKIEKDRYIEYVAIFPLSLLNLGYGSFTIEAISKNTTKLTAYAGGGYNFPIVGPVLDFLVRKVISFDAIRKHMKEEGVNIKRYLEGGSNT